MSLKKHVFIYNSNTCNASLCSRTPFFRSARSTTMGYSKTSNSSLEDAVGLNELEGAVLLDAEDYRRMLQEVKTLKSVLLRLKRELASDVC